MSKPIAVVTGAGKGVGRAVTLAFLEKGIHVIGVTRSKEDLDDIMKETETIRTNQETTFHPVVGDVSEPSTVMEVLEELKPYENRVDILINNAGVGIYKSFEDLTTEDYDTMMDSNMKSTFLFTKSIAPLMKERKYGHIVNVSSVAGKKGLPGESIYCASKFAQVGFAQALDYEMREHGVKVSSICPGGIRTNFAIGTGRSHEDPEMEDFLEAEDVVKAILFVIDQSPKSRVIELFLRPMSEPL